MAKISPEGGYTVGSIEFALWLAKERGDIIEYEHYKTQHKQPRDMWRVKFDIGDRPWLTDELWLDKDQARAFLAGLMCGKDHPHTEKMTQ